MRSSNSGGVKAPQFERSGDFSRGSFFLNQDGARAKVLPAGAGKDETARAGPSQLHSRAEWREPGAMEPVATALARPRVSLGSPLSPIGPPPGQPKLVQSLSVGQSQRVHAQSLTESAVGTRGTGILRRIGSIDVTRTPAAPSEDNGGSRRAGPMGQGPAATGKARIPPAAEQSLVTVAYIVEHGLDLCDRFEALRNLQTAILSANRLSSLSPLYWLPHLRFLDVSDTSIQHILPAPSRPPGFKRLAVLYLHRNLVKRPGSLEMLGQAQAVRALTLYDNPISRDEYYRPAVFSAIPGLLALDTKIKIPHDHFVSASVSAEVVVDPELFALANASSRKAAATPKSDVITVHSDPLQQHHVKMRYAAGDMGDVEHEFKLEILKARNPRDRFNHESMVGWALRRCLCHAEERDAGAEQREEGRE